jgi:antitoxin component of RelBE/YafQ-DinJ toxin-antitoxin module
MRQFNVRVSDDLYEQARAAALASGITLSDFVRDVVSQACRKCDAPEVLDLLRDELSHKNEQIDHLHQLLAIQSKTTAALAEQLDAHRTLIEDLRRRKPPVWKRIFR